MPPPYQYYLLTLRELILQLKIDKENRSTKKKARHAAPPSILSTYADRVPSSLSKPLFPDHQEAELLQHLLRSSAQRLPSILQISECYTFFGSMAMHHPVPVDNVRRHPRILPPPHPICCGMKGAMKVQKGTMKGQKGTMKGQTKGAMKD